MNIQIDDKNKPSLLIVITGLELGGAETLLRSMAWRLREDEYKIKVISLTKLGPVGNDIQSQGVEVSAIGGSVKFDPRLVFRLIQEVRSFKPDILHSHLFHANLLGRVVGTICRIPVVISTIHNVDFGGRLRERLLRWTDFMCTKTVAISDQVRKAMLEKKVVPENKLVTIDNGIDTDEFRRDYSVSKNDVRNKLDLPIDKLIYLSVGRLMEQKGYPYLIEAVEKVVKNDPDVMFIVLGEGEMRAELEKMLAEKGLEKYIEFRGNKSNVGEYMQASDVFVMPSLWEGLPIALMEAMAYELAVVACPVGSVGNVVEEGKTGLLVSAKDVDALANALVKISKEDMDEMGKQARTKIKHNFSIATTVKKYENLYAEFSK